MAIRAKTQHPNDDYVQPGLLYSKVMKDNERSNLISNIVDHLHHAKKFVRKKY